jgi:topoisomerase IA-like protein
LGEAEEANVSLRHELVVALADPHQGTRVRALEAAAAEAPEAYAALAVQLLGAYPQDGYFVLERIGRFGPAVVPPLRALKAATTNPEVVVLSTLALAHFREMAEPDAELLLAAIHERSEYQHLASRALSSLGVASAGPALLAELRATGTDEHDRLTSLVPALRQLDITIPPDEIRRLTPLHTPSWVVALFSAGETRS